MSINPSRKKKMYRLLVERDGPVCHLCDRLIMVANWDKVDRVLFVVRKHSVYFLGFRGRAVRVCRAATIDHVIPLSKGGCNNIGNLKLACHNCNVRRGNTDLPKTPRGG